METRSKVETKKPEPAIGMEEVLKKLQQLMEQGKQCEKLVLENKEEICQKLADQTSETKNHLENFKNAALFLNGGPTHPYVFLETIVEETSDDLRSTDSERSISRGSHEEDERNRVGWLATDSESGSVIRVNVTTADATELDLDDSNSSDGSTSECDIVCPAKRRRRHDAITSTTTSTTPCNSLLTVPLQINNVTANNYNSCDEDTNSLPSLSRSSSLLQFETLEKRCQEDMYNSSPSILSTFSYDSLENRGEQSIKNRLSPDSLNNLNHHTASSSEDSEQESTEDSYRSDDCEYYRTIRIDGKIKRHRGRDSLLYKTKTLNAKNCDADSENSSTESEDAIHAREQTPYSLVQNLKTYRSFESLNTNNGHKKEKMSAENLSEDSGYCDHFVLKQKSSSIPNFQVQGIIIPEQQTMTKQTRTIETTKQTTSLKPPTSIYRKNPTSFDAYDGETHFMTNTASHFGTSYQDLSIFDPNKINIQFKNNLQKLGRYQKRQKRTQKTHLDDGDEFNEIDELERETQSLKLEIASEFTWPTPKFSGTSASEPNLLNVVDESQRQTSPHRTKNTNNSYRDLLFNDFNNDPLVNNNCDAFTARNSNSDFSVTSSVPQNLNLIGTTTVDHKVSWRLPNPLNSVAFKNIDLCDLTNNDELYDKMDKCASASAGAGGIATKTDKGNISTDNNTIIIHLKGSDDSENKTVVGVEHSNNDAADNIAGAVEADVEKSSFSTNDGVSKLLDVTADNRCYNLDIHSDILEFESNLQKAISNSSIPSFKDKADFFFHSTPMNRSQNVRSTPNLSLLTSEKEQFDDVLTGRGSMQHVPLKNADSDSYMKGLSGSEGKNIGGILHRNSLAGSGSTTKGVHFCEIVSEVSWREVSYSDDDVNSRSNSVDSVNHVENEDEQEQKDEVHDDLENIMIKVADQIEHQKDVHKYNVVVKSCTTDKDSITNNNKQTYLTSCAAPNKLNHCVIDDETPPCHVTTSAGSSGVHVLKSSDDNTATNTAAEEVVERLVTRIEVPQESTRTTVIGTNNNHKRQHSSNTTLPVVQEYGVNRKTSSVIMDSSTNNQIVSNQNQHQQSSSKQKQTSKTSGVNKLGGFLSRFTNFRFSTRNKNDKKKAAKTSGSEETKLTKSAGVSTTSISTTAPTPTTTTTTTTTTTANRRDDKPDYIYIPLKGPPLKNTDTSNNTSSVDTNGVFTKVMVDGKPVENNVVLQISENNKENIRLNHHNNNQSVTTKPPLPKLPPRVIGASCKQRNHTTTQTPVTPAAAIHNASSIDSGDSSGVQLSYIVNNKSGGFSCNSSVDRHAATFSSNRQREVFTRNSTRHTLEPQMEQKPLGLIETDLDTHITVVNHHHHSSGVTNGKARSLMNLGGAGAGVDTGNCTGQQDHQHLRIGDGTNHQITVRPHKSMEFLLDKENLKVVEPPENELQKGGTSERVMSEHQLRVQRSLQKLNVPDWFKQSQVPREGFLLKKQRDTNKWSGLTGKTTSLSSLGGSRQSPILLSPSPQNTSGQIGSFTRWSTSKLNSTASSPCNSTRSSFNYRQPITGLTVNGTTSPCSSTRSSFNYRQPYLGWRSQERLAKPRTPAERLATTLLPPPVTNANSEIQSSIKEVTSAIVHYVSGLTPDTNPADGLHVKKDEQYSISPRLHEYEYHETTSQRSISPASRGSQKLCWLESSFVGTRPLDSPETPIGIPTDGPSDMDTIRNTHYASLHLDLKTKNSVNSTENFYPFVNSSSGNLARSTTTTTVRPSPGSTTLEDVLDSLLGLPPSTRAPSPSLQETVSVNSSPGHFMCENFTKSDQNRLLSVSSSKPSYCESFRRRSEGNNTVDHDKTLQTDNEPRRVSFHVTPDSASGIINWNVSSMIKCRYTKCTMQAPYEEAKKYFKNCHNCNYTYCSRECRRAHWEKHRKTCLHSRASTLCRQILAKAKDDADSLKHISLIARQGYLSHGPGVVKCFFPSPEAAERFIEQGLTELSEPTYIRWPDLLPSEMGPELFSELVKICKSYNPDTRLVLYVAVCVVSEVPSAGTIKWERQLVSRCAKLRLSKAIQTDPNLKSTRPVSPASIIQDHADNQQNGSSETKTQTLVQKTRELSFTNIQQQLKHRGISLRRHFPDVYQKLRAYVEGASDRFTPVTVYPKDSSSGKNFMCIIMPDAVESDKLDLVPTDSSRFQTIDVSEEQLKS